MNQVKIKFNNRKRADFAAEVRKSVNQYFEQNGISPHANTAMIIKGICLILITFVPYFLLFTGWFNPWQMLGLVIISGFGVAGVGFSVGHDALHGAYSANNKVNSILGLVFPLVGVSDYLWKIKHNLLHHTFTNIYEHDEDLTVTQFIRLSPNAPHKPIHRIQHWLGLAAYSLLSLGWVVLFDYQKMFYIKRFYGAGYSIVHPKKEVAKLLLWKAIYYTYALVIPLMFLPIAWWQVLVGFVVMHLVTGFTLSIVFQLAHVVENTSHPKPENDGSVDNAWFIHQVETTSDFAMKNKFVTWFVGGLNYQVEHHLFPKICSIHYPNIQPIVKEVAERHGVQYNSYNGFWEAVASHYRVLKQFSKPNPVSENTDNNSGELANAKTAAVA